jgi:hypothetical protein
MHFSNLHFSSKAIEHYRESDTAQMCGSGISDRNVLSDQFTKRIEFEV